MRVMLQAKQQNPAASIQRTFLTSPSGIKVWVWKLRTFQGDCKDAGRKMLAKATDNRFHPIEEPLKGTIVNP